MKKLVAAISAAVLASSANALLPPGLGGSAPDVTINMSGASAPDKVVRELVLGLCTPGTINEFTDRCSSSSADPTAGCAGSTPKFPGKSFGAIYCSIPSSSVAWTDGDTSKDVLFRKRSAGGSFWGTVPVATSLATNEQMVLDSANCGVSAADATVYTCDKDVTEAVVANFGSSDLAPGEFRGVNVGSGLTACDATCLAALDFEQIFQLGFGVVVTNDLYERLQVLQGLTTDTDGNGTADIQEVSAGSRTFSGSESAFADNMPTLTSEWVARLFAGRATNWSDVSIAGTPVGGSTDGVSVCRRVNGSGTGAQFNYNVMSNGCTGSADAKAADTTFCVTVKGDANTAEDPFCAGFTWGAPDLSFTFPPFIWETSGSGDMTSCLDGVQTSTTISTYGIGYQSLEKNSENWAFVKLDGAIPTLDAMFDGEYHDVGGVSLQWRASESDQDLLDILTVIRGNAADPAVLADINDGATHLFDVDGLNTGAMSLTAPTTASLSTAAPVAAFTRKDAGNTCSPLIAR